MVNQRDWLQDEENRAPEGSEYARAVGVRLRAMRKQQQLSLQAVEVETGHEFKASVLGAYERGDRTISLPRLRRLATLYDVPVDYLLPQDEDADGSVSEDAGDGRSRSSGRSRPAADGVEKITIDLAKLDAVTGPDGDVLRRFLSAIQRQRQNFSDRMMTIRAEDVRALACFFGVAPTAVSGRLDTLGLSVPS